MKACSQCHALFTPRSRFQFLCGERECQLAHKRADMAERNRRHIAEHGVTYFDRYKVERICPDCGEAFRTRQGETCRPCQRRRAWEKGAAASVAVRRARAMDRRAQRGQVVLAGPIRPRETLRYRLAARRLERYAEEAPSASRFARPWRFAAGTCRHCGAYFVSPEFGGTVSSYCSWRCGRAEARAVRRARERGGDRVPYRRVEIFARDRWVCQLCGKRVRRRAAVPDPKAPVVDHIIPLAAGEENGGVDAPWNVQCAHFLCNSIKRDQYTAPALF